MAWADNARALGIVLVVLGHAPIGSPLAEFIYAFHMPLFFVLSGALAGSTQTTVGLKRHAMRLGRSLLVPFAFFGAVTVGFHIAMDVATGQHTPDIRHALSVQAAVFHGVAETIPDNSVLWFFPCLFLAALGSLALTRLVGQGAAFALTSAFALAVMTFGPPPTRPPWSADSAVIAAWFFQIGMAFCSGPVGARMISQQVPPTVALAVGLLALLATTQVAAANGGVDLNRVAFGNAALYLLGAVAGVLGVILVATALPPNRVLHRLSENSRVIFPLHILVLRALQGGPQVIFGLEHGWLWNMGAITAPLFVAAGLLIPMPVAWMLRRLAPWTIGIRRPACPAAVDASGQR